VLIILFSCQNLISRFHFSRPIMWCVFVPCCKSICTCISHEANCMGMSLKVVLMN